jgi:hypothetical protein
MLTDVSEVRTAFIIRTKLMTEEERTSETSVNINLTTRRYIPGNYEYTSLLVMLLKIWLDRSV